MTRTDKKRFIRELVTSVTKTALAAVPKMPEEWDGIELREYLADKFCESAVLHNRIWRVPYRKKYRRRAKDYENEVIVRNLSALSV